SNNVIEISAIIYEYVASTTCATTFQTNSCMRCGSGSCVIVENESVTDVCETQQVADQLDGLGIRKGKSHVFQHATCLFHRAHFSNNRENVALIFTLLVAIDCSSMGQLEPSL